MESKEFVDALVQVPELVEAAKTFKETSGHIISSVADAIQKHPQAEIPDSELQKIAATPCAPPKMDSVVKDFAYKVVGIIEPIIKDKVNEALKSAEVTVQHTHSYCFERDLKDVADTRLMKRCLIFGLTTVVLALILAIIAIAHFNSETYWGKQYYEVYSSPYLTEEEWEKISQNVHIIAILPNEFDKDPKRVKEQLKKNKSILKERKKEAKAQARGIKH